MIHGYKLGGLNIVLDVCSGSVHVVDEPTFDVIGMYETHSRGEITDYILHTYAADGVTADELEDCFAQIEALKAAGRLFAPDTFADMAGELKNRSAGVVKALCLHVAHTCNLNCAYCFASQGKYQGERALMSFEVGRLALDYLVAHSGGRRNLEVDFFGGEPLMNFQVVKDLVAYARSIEKDAGKNFRFTLTTNGVLLDDEVTECSSTTTSSISPTASAATWC